MVLDVRQQNVMTKESQIKLAHTHIRAHGNFSEVKREGWFALVMLIIMLNPFYSVITSPRLLLCWGERQRGADIALAG